MTHTEEDLTAMREDKKEEVVEEEKNCNMDCKACG